MSKMKHLLRKLHIGNDQHNPHRRPPPAAAPSATLSPSSSSPSPPSVSVTVDSADRTVPAENVEVNVSVRNPNRDFNFLEEEFQVQLAMALSASDPETSKDEESDQIKAAKQLSLACSPSVPDNERLSEFISLKYWNYNVVQYDERVVDGFYDVYAIASHSIAQGEMPLLVDLQAISIFDDVEYEVVLVNRSIDLQLRQLENKAYAISVEYKFLGNGLFMNTLIQRIANLVVDTMGGPVSNAEEMMKRWRVRTDQLQGSLNTIVLPLGCLDVGLSRHRALLFKVLADRINLPCMLVKGSLYTGTDEGAVNLIKFDDGSEYIIDLMGAPGTLIPAEVPSSLLLDTALEARGFSNSTAAVNNLSVVFDKVVGLTGAMCDLVKAPEICGPNLNDGVSLSTQATQENPICIKSDVTGKSEQELEKPFASEFSLGDGLPCPVEQASLAQEKKVKDVSKYVISAAKDPEFAQKLHAVLLESGAAPPADLFLNMNPYVLGEKKFLEQAQPVGWEVLASGASYSAQDYRSNNERLLLCSSGGKPLNNRDDKGESSVECFKGQQLLPDAKVPCYPFFLEPEGVTAGHEEPVFQDSKGKIMNQIEADEESQSLSPNSGERICPVLGEFAEWEIPWEDLHIGERIGIGSYGEVYRADWNGTEVAVKKFLVQDLTGDVLIQFKCEAEMMIRLRHPNVVLFMGAVTRSPNLSILTEFLPRGSLYRLLHRSGTQVDEKKRMKMALDVAKGMNYLHTSHPTIVHRDLKSPNLLVDKNWGVKVCDFGLSRLKHHTFLSSNSTAGTPEWMAPEVLRNEPANEKCDVYSFGVILWELATLCIPWTGLNPMQVVGAVGFQNRRLEIPATIDPTVAQIIRDCWENDPRQRPSFAQLIPRLKGLQRLIVHRD